MTERTPGHGSLKRWVSALFCLGFLLLIAWLLPRTGAGIYNSTGWFLGATIMVPFFFAGLLGGLLAAAVYPDRSGVPHWYMVAFLIPFLLWDVLSQFIGPSGSLSNAVMEPFWLGVAASVVQVLRLVFSAPSHGKARNRFLLSVAVVAGIAVGFAMWFPALPE